MSEVATLINRQCSIIVSESVGEEDEFSEVREERKAPRDQVVSVCEIQQRDRREDEDQGELSEADWNGFFLPADEENLNSASQLWVEGLGTFEFVGAPWPVRDPELDALSHIEATLRRTAGPADSEGS